MKGQASGNGIAGFAMAIGTAGIVLAILLYVVDTIKTTIASTSADVNATLENTIGAGKDISTWFPILVVAGMGFLALAFFGNRKLNV